MSDFKPRKVTVPLFEMVSNPTVNLRPVPNRSFCSICKIRVDNLHIHCKEINDNLHDVLLTLEE